MFDAKLSCDYPARDSLIHDLIEETIMKSAVLLAALLVASPLPAFAGVAPSTGTSAAAQSGAKVAPKQDQEAQKHENHNSQQENTK